MKDLWSRLERWLSAHAPGLHGTLRGPAEEESLRALQQRLGGRLPPDWEAFYRVHDGQESGKAGLFYGVQFLPLSDVVATLDLWSDPKILAMNENPDIRRELRSRPFGKIRKRYANPLWVPFTHDERGNHIGLDLDPGWLGRRGQIIVFGRDEDVKRVAAPTLRHFLSLFVEQLESGNFVIEGGAPRLKHFLDGKPVDPDLAHFHNLFAAG